MAHVQYFKTYLVLPFLSFNSSACRFCNYVRKSVDERNFAHSHTCKMCAFFITALLSTGKIQESQFAYLPTYNITKTALIEIVLWIKMKVNFNLLLNLNSKSFDGILLLHISFALKLIIDYQCYCILLATVSKQCEADENRINKT